MCYERGGRAHVLCRSSSVEGYRVHITLFHSSFRLVFVKLDGINQYTCAFTCMYTFYCTQMVACD